MQRRLALLAFTLFAAFGAIATHAVAASHLRLESGAARARVQASGWHHDPKRAGDPRISQGSDGIP